MADITTCEELETLYGLPGESSLVKEVDHLTPHYRALIEASPFLALATSGPEGLDCSPRGDAAARLIRVVDDETIMLPDRRGNNRIDSLRNIVRDPRVALLFLIPGLGQTLRVNGKARISADADLLESFRVDGHAPRSVVIIKVEKVYFQCARAIARSKLWRAEAHIDPASLPTPGEILASLSGDKIGGAAYDREWPERAAKTMW